MTEPAVPTAAQREALAARWARNPYSVRDLFDGVRAVPTKRVLAHLQGCGLSSEQAVGWLATMTQVGRLQMVSLELVQLGARAEPPASPTDVER